MVEVSPRPIYSLLSHIKRFLRKWWFPLIFGFISLSVLFGILGPVLSPLGYQAIAPSGWRNITPHGNTSLYASAVSADVPGLMVGCGTLFTIRVFQPVTWRPGMYHLWLSRDYGSTWDMLDTPFGDIGDCELAIPPGGQGTIVAAIGDSAKDKTALWISHDEGKHWQHTVSIANPPFQVSTGIKAWTYRHGILYGQPIETDFPIPFGVSVDDGKMWRPLPVAIDPAFKGYEIYKAYLPDYRDDHAWLREIDDVNGQRPSLLLRSTDDGSTWAMSATLPFKRGNISLSSLAPGGLCAVSDYSTDGKIWVGSDGGGIWRPFGLAGLTPQSQYSEPQPDALLDAHGNCYFINDYRLANSDQYRTAIIALSAQTGNARVIANGLIGEIFARTTYFAPDSHNGRLIMRFSPKSSSWAGMFCYISSEASNTVFIAHELA